MQIWIGGQLELAPSQAAKVALFLAAINTYDRVSMHGVRRQLVTDQADALGVPVQFVVIPHQDDPSCPMAHTTPGTAFPPNDTYTRTMLEALQQLKAEEG